MSAWSVKPDVLCPGIVEIRGSTVLRQRPCIILRYPPLPLFGVGVGLFMVVTERVVELNHFVWNVYPSLRAMGVISRGVHMLRHPQGSY